jgi:hypothetical protein
MGILQRTTDVFRVATNSATRRAAGVQDGPCDMSHDRQKEHAWIPTGAGADIRMDEEIRESIPAVARDFGETPSENSGGDSVNR